MRLINEPSELKDIFEEDNLGKRLIKVKVKVLKEDIWTVIIPYRINEDARSSDKTDSIKNQGKDNQGEI